MKNIVISSLIVISLSLFFVWLISIGYSAGSFFWYLKVFKQPFTNAYVFVSNVLMSLLYLVNLVFWVVVPPYTIKLIGEAVNLQKRQAI